MLGGLIVVGIGKSCDRVMVRGLAVIVVCPLMVQVVRINGGELLLLRLSKSFLATSISFLQRLNSVAPYVDRLDLLSQFDLIFMVALGCVFYACTCPFTVLASRVCVSKWCGSSNLAILVDA